MSGLTLVLGNKNYSSWSLRAWLALAVAGAKVEEVVIPLDRDDTPAALARWSPAAKVPVLHDGALVIWDSLAIVEYAAELFPEAGLLPADRAARAVARSAMAEMHSGFAALRREMPMDVRTRAPRSPSPAVQRDIERICALWHDCMARFGGDGGFLFDGFGAADCMFAPVASRFRTYEVALPADAEAYVARVLDHPQMRAWAAAAAQEPWVIEEP